MYIECRAWHINFGLPFYYPNGETWSMNTMRSAASFSSVPFASILHELALSKPTGDTHSLYTKCSFADYKVQEQVRMLSTLASKIRCSGVMLQTSSSQVKLEIDC